MIVKLPPSVLAAVLALVEDAIDEDFHTIAWSEFEGVRTIDSDSREKLADARKRLKLLERARTTLAPDKPAIVNGWPDFLRRDRARGTLR